MNSSRNRHLVAGALLAALAAAGIVGSLRLVRQHGSQRTVTTGGDAAGLLASLPMQFEVNAGQAAPEVRYLARGAGYVAYLADAEAVLQLHSSFSRTDVLRMQLARASRPTRVHGEGRLGGDVNYFTSAEAHTDIATYGRVRYDDIYDRVDLVYYGTQGRLEYDFVVAPDGNPSDIQLALRGARDVTVTDAGDLSVDVGGRSVTWRAPVSYQPIGRVRRAVDSRYVVRKDGDAFAVAFEVGSYDRSRPLIIDPVIAYSTFLSGTNQESGYAIGVDHDGHVYVAGSATSLDYPRTKNPLQNVYAGGRQDVFVTKLDVDGKEPKVQYSTYLGGSGDDFVLGLALRGGDGPEVYLTGATSSTDFPTTEHAFQPTNRGGYDGFVARLAGDGKHLDYSSYLGGSGDENLGLFGGIAVTKEGEALVTGSTTSADFPVSGAPTPAFQSTLRGAANAFVVRVKNDGHSIVYASYLGGDGTDSGAGIAVDDSGNAYVVGSTTSTTFPVTAGAVQAASNGNGDGFLTKVGPKGALVYSTYLGGSDVDFATGVALDDPDGGEIARRTPRVYVVGATASTNFPTTAGVFQTATTGPVHAGYDAFVTRFNRTTTGLDYSTLVGGSEVDVAHGVAVDVRGSAYVVGVTLSNNFPRADPFKASLASGDSDGFVAKLSPQGNALVYSSYLGGGAEDAVQAVAIDRYGAAYVTGHTTARDFPTTPLAAQPMPRGITMAFVTKVAGAAKPLKN